MDIQTHVSSPVSCSSRGCPSAVGSVVCDVPQAGDHEVVSVVVFSRVEVAVGDLPGYSNYL